MMKRIRLEFLILNDVLICFVLRLLIKKEKIEKRRVISRTVLERMKNGGCSFGCNELQKDEMTFSGSRGLG